MEIEKKPPTVLVRVRGLEYQFMVLKTDRSFPWLVAVMIWPEGRFVDLLYAKEELYARHHMKRAAQLAELGKEV